MFSVTSILKLRAEAVNECKMGDEQTPNRAVLPETSHGAQPPITAQDGSTVIAPQFNGVTINDGNLILNVQSSVKAEETRAVSPKRRETIENCQRELKSYLLSKTRTLSQGTKEDPSSTPLNKIYTELYITEGGSGEVNSEHEVIELQCTRGTSEERKIHLNDIFKPLSTEGDPPQRVLTKGIAGIGKSVAVQKFTRDWAAGVANQTFDFIFPFTFRDLNLIKAKQFSLMDLILHYFEEEVEDLQRSDYKRSSVLLIFDGLDESKLPLDFDKNDKCRSITKKTTVDGLLTNLIEGEMFHKASVWITSRPAAVGKIPHQHINRLTEVRGFNDEQKEEYFLKKIPDQTMARKILDHLQSKPMRSLHIMCHIPIFCWISATALQSLLKSGNDTELPKTLTEMYTHFLIIQTKLKQQKAYQECDTNRDMIMKLGKLAFEQLQQGNIIFYEKDLNDCQIDLKQAAVYSGVCTQIIRKDQGLHKVEVYSFIHLSIQEFLAAWYVQETFIESGENLLNSNSVRVNSEKGVRPINFLHVAAVNKALKSDYGQWDLFLRFLLGLSQDKNQKRLQKDFGLSERLSQSSQDTIIYIHEKIKKLTYTEKSINLFHCLNELGDQSLVKQVQKYQSSGDVSKISPSHWSALAFVLLVSNDDLSTFDLKKYYGSDEVLERLLPVLKVSKTALLNDCNLTDRCCRYICSALTLKSSGLEELDLSRNTLQDSGMKLLSEGLGRLHCNLQKLRMEQCRITQEGCQSLVSGLSLNPSYLKELDLSKNKCHDDGAELLSQVLRNCSLETLRLRECGITEHGCRCLLSALSVNYSHLKNLDLSMNKVGSQAIVQLSDLLKHHDCQLERLWLFKTKLQAKDAAVLASVLVLNPTHLRELDLGGNVLCDLGVNEISSLLKNPNCKLEVLRLEGCRFTASSCAALVSSLKSNPAHLRVLHLTRNDLKDCSVEKLSEFLEESCCRLETLNLKCCALTAAGCRSLTVTLSHSSTLRELDLSYNRLGDEGLRLLSHWLKTPQCRLEILRLSDCTETSCELLASALRSNPSHLRELELSRSRPGEPGLKLLSDLQKEEGCKLQTLTVND
ncbi:NACHT, LRR and PYD domains-containing protein 12-like [Melanotaenia boesemani]|uniref:NACHT, LRR and PYD domains-containing protein 12-like n=1 Tax=Melanotaenia boesemani TaxID=1250792 RepID=UPI001C045218|nr:NACHT, LRR and PYD domains-containing protein 12-like [Melanotaenia boesemani]